MRYQHTLFCALVSVGVLACGSSDGDDAPATATDTQSTTDDANQSASDVAAADSSDQTDDDVQERADVEDNPLAPFNQASVDGPGPFQVAYRTQDVTYTPIQLNEARAVRLAVWYPTESTTGDPPTYPFGIFPVERDGILADAPPLEGDRPVMIYSHGNFGFAEAHYTLCEHFASHGWLVLAPDHTGNTWNAFTDRDTDTYLNRPQDLSAALDAVAPDAEHVAVVGHSYGGYTAFAIAGAVHDFADCDDPENTSDFCSLLDADRRAAFAEVADPRVDLIVPMAAGNARNIEGDGAGVAAIDMPVFLLTGTLDNANTNEANGDPFWTALDGNSDRRLNLANGGHQSFASTCLHYEVGIEDGDGCAGDEFIPPSDALDIVNEYVLAFARYHLTGDTDQQARLDGPAANTFIELSSK